MTNVKSVVSKSSKSPKVYFSDGCWYLILLSINVRVRKVKFYPVFCYSYNKIYIAFKRLKIISWKGYLFTKPLKFELIVSHTPRALKTYIVSTLSYQATEKLCKFELNSGRWNKLGKDEFKFKSNIASYLTTNYIEEVI